MLHKSKFWNRNHETSKLSIIFFLDGNCYSFYNRYQTSPFCFPQQHRLRFFCRKRLLTHSLVSLPRIFTFFAAIIFFKELKFNTRAIYIYTYTYTPAYKKKRRLKNDVDKGLMFAIIYVADKTCWFCTSQEKRGASRSSVEWSAIQIQISIGRNYWWHYRFIFDPVQTDIWTTRREIERGLLFV